MKGGSYVARFWIQLLQEGLFFQFFGWPQMYLNRKRRSKQNFSFNNKEYSYFSHRYNCAWRNERTVEVPIVWDKVKGYEGRNILEVGNVLSHYFSINHDILDKYEKGENVINQDVVGFSTKKKYDLIVSISTLEHIGWYWHEDPRKYKKVKEAVECLKKALSKNGKLMFTIPYDYNQKLDNYILNNEIKFDEVYFLKRVSKDNLWKQVDKIAIQKVKYGRPYHSANGVVVCIYKKA